MCRAWPEAEYSFTATKVFFMSVKHVFLGIVAFYFEKGLTLYRNRGTVQVYEEYC